MAAIINPIKGLEHRNHAASNDDKTRDYAIDQSAANRLDYEAGARTGG